MTINSISDRNPDLEQMREQGWAYVACNNYGEYGAPYTSEGYAEGQVRRFHPDDDEWDDDDDEGQMELRTLDTEVRIISWEQPDE